MLQDELAALLARSRRVLEQYLVDDEDHLRDDVAEMCMAIDDALPEPNCLGIAFHWQPVAKTYKMPPTTFRMGSRGRPPLQLRL